VLENSGIVQTISFSGRNILRYYYYYYYHHHHHQQQQQQQQQQQYPIPATLQSKAWVCGPSLTWIVDSNPAAAMDVCLL